MKEHFNKLINEANNIRSDIYYQLNQLNQITGLSSRMLKYKMKDVKEKYLGVPHLLKKVGKSWQIHYTLISEFMPINKKKTFNENNYNWQSFATWNPYQNYDTDYHFELIKEIKTILPNNIIKYTIEMDRRGYNHVHFISDATVQQTKETVEQVISKYFSWHEVIYQVTEINNKYSSVSYINKAPIKNGTL
jgi:hypothetical protein